MLNDDLFDLARMVLRDYSAHRLRVATAESCTGGMISETLTAIPGSSAVFDRSFITYSDVSKTEMLGVPAELMQQHGSVSAEAAQAMAIGALNNSNADVAVSATGIAGPDGGSLEKPVGLVYIGLASTTEGVMVERHIFTGTRTIVRMRTTERVLQFMMSLTLGRINLKEGVAT